MEWSDLQNSKITRMNHDIPNWESMIEQVLYREAEEESGLKVEDPRYLTSVAFVRPDGVPCICPKFAVKYKSGKVKISSEFEDYAWVNEKEVKRYSIIRGIDKEIALTISTYKS